MDNSVHQARWLFAAIGVLGGGVMLLGVLAGT